MNCALILRALNSPERSSWAENAEAEAKKAVAARKEKALVKRIVYEEIVQRAERAE